MNWLLILLSFFFCSTERLPDPPYGMVEQAFHQADAAKIVSWSKEKVMITIQSKEAVYAQSQAVQILKDFFVKHPNTAFKFVAKSKEGPDAALAVGSLSNKSEQFNVTIRWTKSGTELRIESIRIEKSN